MNDISAPLLSICIPTYNRARLLAKFLPLILEEAGQFTDQVEIIVSDNNSTDETNAIVNSLKSKFPLVYHRQSENIGAGRNFLFLADRLARGKFCWIIGDDDIVVPGAIRKVLSIITAHPLIDYIFAREINVDLREIDTLIHQPGSIHFADLTPFLRESTPQPKPSRVLTFDELIDPAIRFDYLGFIANSIFRKDIWRQAKTDHITGHPFDSWENTYPHLYIFGKSFIGRQAYYCSDISIICGNGSMEWQGNGFWEGYLPLIFLQYFDEILTHYHSCGLHENQLSKCRKAQAEIYGRHILGYLMREFIKGTQISGANQIMLRRALKYSLLGSFWRVLTTSIGLQIMTTIGFPKGAHPK